MPSPDRDADLYLATTEVTTELKGAMWKYPPMNTPHEGYAVILEELDELWEQVRHKQVNHNKALMRAEAKQVAAMAIRFMVDLT